MIGLIVVLVIIVGLGIGAYKYGIITGKVNLKKGNNVFSSKAKTQQIQRIRNDKLQDDFYQGKRVKLDPSFKYVIKNALFQFPNDELTIKSFNSFSIDGNELNIVNFDGNQYIALWDDFENKLTFYQKVMTNSVSDFNPILENELELTEEDKQHTYRDASGLVEVDYRDNDGKKLNERLIRLYEQVSSHEEVEYLLLTMDNTTHVTYYVGYNIELSQLESV